MENPGIVTLDAGMILSERGDDQDLLEHDLLTAAAHELSHMGFGNLVTITTWDGVWVQKRRDLPDAPKRVRGAALIGMMETFQGTSVFRDGIRRYLRRHEDGNASPSEFLAEVAGADAAAWTAVADSSLGVEPRPTLRLALECAAAGPPRLILSHEAHRRTASGDSRAP